MLTLRILAGAAVLGLAGTAYAAEPMGGMSRAEATKTCASGKVTAIAGGKYTCEGKMEAAAPMAPAHHYKTRAAAAKACDSGKVTAVAGGKYTCAPMEPAKPM